MRIVISGTSGLIGSTLVPRLRSSGYEVWPLVRRQPSGNEIQWDPAQPLNPAVLEGKDAIIHLAGRNVATLWTDKAKHEIRESRVKSTQSIASAIAQTKDGPKVFICASAVGFYGDRGDEVLTEGSSSGSGFLAEVCKQWEAATHFEASAAIQSGVRTVILRTGIVLSKRGGALAKMTPAFKLGVAGRLGSGQQWMSWISLEDEVRAIQFALENSAVTGPINLVSPTPVTNADFTATLDRILHRPTFIPVPAFAIRLVMGEMGQSTLLASMRVLPESLTQHGFKFEHEYLEDALKVELQAR